jgi:MFS family permease
LAAIVPDLTPLRESRDFQAVFASRTVAWLGAEAAEVALLVQAKQLTNSPLAVSLLGLAELGPLLIFGLYGGVLADRLDRKTLMRWCEPGLAACAGLLLVNALLPRPQLWPLFAVSALMVTFLALQRPSFDAAIPRLVPRAQQTAAVALMSMSMNATVLAGASVGGVLAGTPGPASVYALDAAGFVVSFFLLSRLPALPQTGAGQREATARSGQGNPEAAGAGDGHDARPRAVLGDVWAGLRYAASRKDLLGSYLADLAAMIFAYPNALIPFMAAVLGAPWATGLMFAAPSAGAFAVSATSGWMNRVRRHGIAIAVSAACWGLALAGFGLAPDIWAGLLLLAIAGGADEASAIFRGTLWNQTIPDEVRGRMAGIELLSYSSGLPVGQVRSGAVASVTSVRFSQVSGGLACVVAVVAVCAALPSFRRYHADIPPHPRADAGPHPSADGQHHPSADAQPRPGANAGPSPDTAAGAERLT